MGAADRSPAALDACPQFSRHVRPCLPKRFLDASWRCNLVGLRPCRPGAREVAEEYVCPITAELPIDPVTAEDGRCYERCAIEEWFARQPQAQVKSPVT